LKFKPQEAAEPHRDVDVVTHSPRYVQQASVTALPIHSVVQKKDFSTLCRNSHCCCEDADERRQWRM